eukprot:TRINITY_DN4050_c0_g1_i8.p1 TRINITY_DN4050_c0_g1~~TRINITY_DN4050_c0_g1_i8.p1  ORF type:complete len:260 (-),score=31.13 TRINITY_DN4050_c0_g1_i8:386-1165(-)
MPGQERQPSHPPTHQERTPRAGSDGAGVGPSFSSTPSEDKRSDSEETGRRRVIFVTKKDDGECFPGHAIVRATGGAATELASVAEGQFVLVQDANGDLRYEAVLGFIHALPDEQSTYISAIYSGGELRVSDGHLVFTADPDGTKSEKKASELVAGDYLGGVVEGEENASLQLLAVTRSVGQTGMFAPLTPSGKLVVDGAVVSSYASAPRASRVSHCAMHSSMFAARFWRPAGRYIGAAFALLQSVKSLFLAVPSPSVAL